MIVIAIAINLKYIPNSSIELLFHSRFQYFDNFTTKAGDVQSRESSVRR